MFIFVKKMNFVKKISPFYQLSALYILIGFVIRILLIFHPITETAFSVLEILKIFGFGLLSDLFVCGIIMSFLWLYLIFISDSKYSKPIGYVIFSLFLILLGYVSFCNTILNEYGGSLPEIGITFVALKTVFFGLLLFLPQYRSKIRLWLYSFVVFLFVLVMLQNGISEYLFWNEFGVKYNFIAVDYLVYTNEVIGNIMQSYPVIPIFAGLFIISGTISFYIVQKTKKWLIEIPTFLEKIKITTVLALFFCMSLIAIPFLAKEEKSNNIFANELQSNGLYKFYLAFSNSELDYFTFYKTLPTQEAFAILKNQITTIEGQSTARKTKSGGTEIHKNVVLITIESYSAEFLECYGNEQKITPFLDSLATKSLQFTNLYAVGNRTVRGLEAVTLCLPPTPGESVVKRKDNKHKFSTGSVFAQKGYTVKYLYGGDAYFDNMRDFFGGNDYEIVDKTSFNTNEITFSNVWGVCDEDMCHKAIKVMNEESRSKKPFFNHIMTVSNHRPFTYPEGKIDISGGAKSREGGVKYTDFAMRRFFEMAKKQDWYSNTVFVILSDHCASSAGKTELPLDKYRIPAMIFDPNTAASRCNKLMSQIDVMPTLFGLLNFEYKSKFFGQNVLDADYKPRAFIATYQNLGLIKDNILTIISPKQRAQQFDLKQVVNSKLDLDFQIYFQQLPNNNTRKDLVDQTISYYQTASFLLKNKGYEK